MEHNYDSTKRVDREIVRAKVKMPTELDNRPWHEKYRWDTLDDIVGQDENVELDQQLPFIEKVFRYIPPDGEQRRMKEIREQQLRLVRDGEPYDHRALEEALGKLSLIRSHYQINAEERQDGYTHIKTIPNIFSLARILLTLNLKVIIGAAKLREHVINNQQIKTYFDFQRGLLAEQLLKRIDALSDNESEETVKQVSAELRRYDRLMEPKIQEYKAITIPALTIVYNISTLAHSYSKSHYTRRKKGESEEKHRQRIIGQVKVSLNRALTWYQKATNHSPDRIFLITYAVLKKAILSEQEKIKRSKKKPTGENAILNKVEPHSWFGDFHGINPQHKFDLIITYGDPLDPEVTQFANRIGITEKYQKMQTGFTLKKEADIGLKKIIVESYLAEIVEGALRSRGKIPVLAISNFLQSRQKDEDIVKLTNKMLSKDNIHVIDLFTVAGVKKEKEKIDTKLVTKEGGEVSIDF